MPAELSLCRHFFNSLQSMLLPFCLQNNVAINLLDVTTQGKPLIVEGGAAINSQIVQRNVAGLIGK